AGELLDRPLGLEPPRAARNQAHEGRALASCHAGQSVWVVSSHVSSSFHGIAPARISVVVVVVTSTIVDGGPPRVGPMSSRKSIRSPSVCSTVSGSAVAGSPLIFALVAVTGRPHRAQTARATSSFGTRMATVDLLPVTSRDNAGGAETINVSGPGQYRSARRPAMAGSAPQCAVT